MQIFDPIVDVIEAVRRGEMVVVADDEARENEGDLVFAAEKVTDAGINFMATHGRGLICVATTTEHLRGLGLSRMTVKGKGDAFETAFMESVDAAEGVSTGISAHDRAETVRVLMAAGSTKDDLVSPGHTFPLEARKGGVLVRAGHTEAAVDLARLAGLKPAGVICEILQEDGSMARMPQLKAFVNRHGLKMTSIANLIAYRRQTESLVKLIRTADLPTRHGLFKLKLFESTLDDEHHVALVMGEPAGESNLAR